MSCDGSLYSEGKPEKNCSGGGYTAFHCSLRPLERRPSSARIYRYRNNNLKYSLFVLTKEGRGRFSCRKRARRAKGVVPPSNEDGCNGRRTSPAAFREIEINGQVYKKFFVEYGVVLIGDVNGRLSYYG